MGSYRSDGRASERAECGIYPHPNCTACGGPVSRRSIHQHDYNRTDGTADTVCTECAGLCAAAALIVLKALDACGLNLSAADLLRLWMSGNVAVLLQAVLIGKERLN